MYYPLNFKIRSYVHASLDFHKLMRSVQIPLGSLSRTEDDWKPTIPTVLSIYTKGSKLCHNCQIIVMRGIRKRVNHKDIIKSPSMQEAGIDQFEHYH